MARRDFRLPDIGEGVTEGEIVEWFVQVGDRVREDDPMVEVMTDKATVTIGAPCDGRVERLCFEVGALAKVGQVILTLDAKTVSRPAASAVGEIEEELPGARLFAGKSAPARKADASHRPRAFGASEAPWRRSRSTEVPVPVPAPPYFDDAPLATPATRRLAKELGVDLRRVRPSGPGDRVTADDVRGAASIGETGPEQRKPIVGVRRKIAERMHRAKSTAAHFTFVEECDASALIALRARLQPEATRRGVPLSYLPFVIRAVTDALRAHPVLNSSVDEARNELVYKQYFHIGVATATDAGLVVPVVRDADRLDLFELAGRVQLLSEGARAGTLRPEELRGSTFTVTSLGKQSGLLATPILNHPEVGILGVHRIKERPVVRNGAIVIGSIMLLSLSLDHRIVDGHVGAAFMYDVIDGLEDPERWLGELDR